MIQKALDWARKTGNIRTNEIHGEEEIRMIISETFVHKEMKTEETNREGTIEVEAGAYHRSFFGFGKPSYTRMIKFHISHAIFLGNPGGQDDAGTLLDTDMPDINGPNDALVPQAPGGSGGAGSASSNCNASQILSFK